MSQPPEVQAAIAEVRRGNRDAFRRLVELYALPLQSYLASQIYRTDEADDIAQEVFIAAYRAIHKFRPDQDFAAWLRGIARNEVLMYFRGKARRESALDRFREEVARVARDELDRAAADDRTEAIERLLLCIARLPDRLRRVVRAGLSGTAVAVLADELGTTAGAVYNLHFRANRMLRACLELGDG
ncbi:MAG TPA: sigma-70 family RNA polymerase sigma factor [Urbifossiella sp.]|jgi:RNA polymerase sigma-70 factor (ECF subfamily)|nr:sigma-70 family RNA polymerase sigma factor [Urbifossiella sp.]